jgi:hypothetical protein
MEKFDYLLEKIYQAPFVQDPFPHVEIKNFLKEEHFNSIVHSEQIDTTGFHDTNELIDALETRGWKVMKFPGCVNSRQEYLRWLNGESKHKVHLATASFGMVFRLEPPDGTILQELDDFFQSDKLIEVLREKFGISDEIYTDTGIQKYLHGYEISPHPDIKSKALTWMVNINPSSESENLDMHTHYLKFKDEWRYIQEFWKYNEEADTDWVPWEWCRTIKQQTSNNSAIFFKPDHRTLHAVKANYNHLYTQRTQFYGNLWYYKPRIKRIKVKYPQLDLINRAREQQKLNRARQQQKQKINVRQKVTNKGKSLIKRFLGKI